MIHPHEALTPNNLQFDALRPSRITGQRWHDVCALSDVLPGTGVAALVGRHQIAIVRDPDGQRVYALSNYDPFSHAFVIARGIVGNRGSVPKIASPIFKQTFDLRTGQCLDDASVRLPTYPVRINGERVEVSLGGSDAR